MVNIVDRAVVTKDIASGAKIIAGPSTFMPKRGPQKFNNRPFRISVPIPNDKTRNGIRILVSIGHKIALIRLTNMMNSATSLKLVNLTPNPKKLIKYIPIMFPINIIRLLLIVIRGGLS